MKQYILPSIRLTLVCIGFFCGIYTLIILGAAQAAPAKGKGEPVMLNGKVVGYALEGQGFTKDNYFWSRPSAVGYNAAGSGGSNKGPSNPDYLKDVQSRIDTFLAHNPGIAKEQIPSDLVTASGSGLDPDISPDAAFVQAKRIAAIRKISEADIRKMIEQNTEKPLLGIFGTERVNVLRLNIALDTMSK
ncbi:MAG TPA: K(+)-transporting ATPase subunit C [Puia sp.]|uniref:K(+)-transporting ATPase subunit C n=1 Tax=Puia sp. TaxID=2045100 RepID=UPI002BC32A07|nr:K(+)-transporting ATPase subunit C [Puia sp.]HVU97108.1 K(+)-transporting ATPase subunit C [Puia sp.]